MRRGRKTTLRDRRGALRKATEESLAQTSQSQECEGFSRKMEKRLSDATLRPEVTRVGPLGSFSVNP